MWGLMTRVDIPANTFVIEYTGEVITKKEADHRGLYYDKLYSNYLFDLNTHVAHKSGNKYLIDHHEIEITEWSKDDIIKDFPLCIDAFYYGNLSRFINHSCDPNLKAINVHVENRNMLLGRVAFFSTRAISKREELTIDYHCLPLDKNGDEESELKCLCGSEKCKGYVYTNVKKKEKMIKKGNPFYDPIYI
jgi:histone-lysine N-methyltransferase SUV39H